MHERVIVTLSFCHSIIVIQHRISKMADSSSLKGCCLQVKKKVMSVLTSFFFFFVSLRYSTHEL